TGLPADALASVRDTRSATGRLRRLPLALRQPAGPSGRREGRRDRGDGDRPHLPPSGGRALRAGAPATRHARCPGVAARVARRGGPCRNRGVPRRRRARAAPARDRGRCGAAGAAGQRDGHRRAVPPARPLSGAHSVAAARRLAGRRTARRASPDRCPPGRHAGRGTRAMMRRRHVFWSGLDAAAAAVMSFVSAFAVARMVGPAEVGIGAAAIAVHVMLWVLLTASFADAIVQRTGLSDAEAASAFWAAVLAGVVLGIAQAGSGLLLSPALHDPRLLPMGVALALPLPLVGAAAVAQGIATRARSYRLLATRTVIGQGLGAVCGLVAAACGAGAWAVVIQQAVGSAAGALTLVVSCRLLPRPRARLREVGGMLAVGLPLALSTLVQTGRYRLFALLLGAVAGPGPLGQIHLSFRLVDTLRDLTATALWRLMLPELSERQRDPQGQLAAADRYLAAYAGL